MPDPAAGRSHRGFRDGSALNLPKTPDACIAAHPSRTLLASVHSSVAHEHLQPFGLDGNDEE